MISVLDHLAAALKGAREKAGTSQRALATRTGMTQAQVSKIENALVDPRTSTLIELCRALDLELVLVPRESVPLVRRLSDTGGRREPDGTQRALYALDDEGDGG